jgi:hypothetical protein
LGSSPRPFIPSHITVPLRACAAPPPPHTHTRARPHSRRGVCGPGPGAAPTLLVADQGNNRVHEVDVVALAPVGFLCRPGSLVKPRVVAATPTLLAVSAWDHLGNPRGYGVFLFDAQTRAPLRKLGLGRGRLSGQLDQPCGLAVSEDGALVAVADWGNSRVCLLRTDTGVCVGHVARDASLAVNVLQVGDGWCTERGQAVVESSPAHPHPHPCPPPPGDRAWAHLGAPGVESCALAWQLEGGALDFPGAVTVVAQVQGGWLVAAFDDHEVTFHETSVGSIAAAGAIAGVDAAGEEGWHGPVAATARLPR